MTPGKCYKWITCWILERSPTCQLAFLKSCIIVTTLKIEFVYFFFSTGLVRTLGKYDTNGKLCRTWPGPWNSGYTSTGTILTPRKQRKSFSHLAHKWHLCRWASYFSQLFHKLCIYFYWPQARVLQKYMQYKAKTPFIHNHDTRLGKVFSFSNLFQFLVFLACLWLFVCVSSCLCVSISFCVHICHRLCLCIHKDINMFSKFVKDGSSLKMLFWMTLENIKSGFNIHEKEGFIYLFKMVNSLQCSTDTNYTWFWLTKIDLRFVIITRGFFCRW